MSHGEDLWKTLQAEREKLDDIVTDAPERVQEINAIVDAYHQAICVSSILGALRQTQDDAESRPDYISRAEDTLLKFNSKVHPHILAGLVDSISKMTSELQADSTTQSKEDIEDRSAAYEELRQRMSTREFVEQYGAELSSHR